MARSTTTPKPPRRTTRQRAAKIAEAVTLDTLHELAHEEAHAIVEPDTQVDPVTPTWTCACEHTRVQRTEDRVFGFHCLHCDTQLTQGALPNVVTILPVPEETPEEPRTILRADDQQGTAPALDTHDAEPSVRAPVPPPASIASDAFLAKVQYVFELVAQGEEAVAAARRRGQLHVRVRQPRPARTSGGGSAVGRKMDPEKVRDFRRRHAAGETVEALGTFYQISPALARNIAKGLRWGSVV